MQSPFTAQIRTAIEMLKKYGEHHNHHASNAVVELAESHQSGHQAGRIATGTIEQTMLAEAGAFARLGLYAIKGSIANAATDQTVTCFHVIFHATTRINEANSDGVGRNRWFTVRYAEFLPDTEIGVRFGVSCGRHDSKPLLHSQLRMEPMAGIAQGNLPKAPRNQRPKSSPLP